MKASTGKLSRVDRTKLTKAIGHTLTDKPGLKSALGRGEVTKTLAKKYSNYFTPDGKLRKMNERQALQAFEEIRKGGDTEFSSKSASAQKRSFLEESKALRKMSEEEADVFLIGGESGLEKFRTSKSIEAAPSEKPEDIAKMEQKAQTFGRLGQTQMADSFARKAFGKTVDWLKGTGQKKEAGKLVDKKISEISDPKKTPPPDPLGPEV